jgi:hypothetical protein
MTRIETAAAAVETAYLTLCTALGTLAMALETVQRGEDITAAEALPELWSGQLHAQRARGLRPVTGAHPIAGGCRALPMVAGNPALGEIPITAAASE